MLIVSVTCGPFVVPLVGAIFLTPPTLFWLSFVKEHQQNDASFKAIALLEFLVSSPGLVLLEFMCLPRLEGLPRFVCRVACTER